MRDSERPDSGSAAAGEPHEGAALSPIPGEEDERRRIERIIERETRQRREAQDFGDPDAPEPPD